MAERESVDYGPSPVQPSPNRREIRKLLALGAPSAATQLGAMMLGVVDTIMVGQVSVQALDAAALGNLWLFGTMVLGMGIVFGMDPLVTQAHGARDRRGVGLALQRGIVVALGCSLPIGLAWLFTGPALTSFGQSPALVDDAATYVIIQIPSLPAFLVFQALRQYLQGRGIVAPALWVTLVANLFNAFVNWVLIFGHLGAPALGLEGAAIATALTRLLLLVLLLGWVLALRLHDGGWVPWTRAAFERRGLVQLLKFGVPVGVQFGLEVWAFQIATLFAGRLGERELAAHVAVLQLASLSFMLPLGLALGATTRVGNLIGAGRRFAAQRAATLALGMGAAVMMFSAVAFVLGRDALPRLFTDDLHVVALAATVLPVAAAFQLFDGTQAVGAGILRGMGSTRPAAWFNLFGFYGLALPLAGWLGARERLGLPGIWWGMCAGLATVAGLYVFWVRTRGPGKVAG